MGPPLPLNGSSCAGTLAPLAGATVQAESRGNSWTFQTGADGSYATWLDSFHSPLQMIAAKDGYMPQTKQVKFAKGKTTRADFTLRKAGC